MVLPSITVDLNKIEHNTRVLVAACNKYGIQVVGVAKACLGNREVANAMIKGGATAIADSRLQNLKGLQNLEVPLMMLRQPMAWEVPRVVEITGMCLVSELKTIRLLSGAAQRIRKDYKIIVMIETGDLREGVLPGDLYSFTKEALALPRITVEGIGSNVACLQGVTPTPSMLELLVESADHLREHLGIDLPIVSGGNSSAWHLIETGSIPTGVNQFRLGEAILLGQETIHFDPIPGTYQNAFVITAEIIEVRDKPVIDAGERLIRRAILALGAQDICRGILTPLDVGVRLLRRSSDHLVVDVSDSKTDYAVGETLSFIPSYEALLAAMTSPFVEKMPVR